MSRTFSRSYVFAVEFRIAQPERILPVLIRHQESLIDLGAHYAFVYESITEPGNVLVTIGVRTEQPLLNLLRSPFFLEWFDAVGVDDIPAVFAGESVEQFDIGEPPEPGRELIVTAVTPVDDVEEFIDRVRDSLGEFQKFGIRKTLIYRAFDTPHEVMFVQQLASVDSALEWIDTSDVAAAWLDEAGVGAYPPVFVGRFVDALRLTETASADPH